MADIKTPMPEFVCESDTHEATLQGAPINSGGGARPSFKPGIDNEAPVGSPSTREPLPLVHPYGPSPTHDLYVLIGFCVFLVCVTAIAVTAMIVGPKQDKADSQPEKPLFDLQDRFAGEN